MARAEAEESDIRQEAERTDGQQAQGVADAQWHGEAWHKST